MNMKTKSLFGYIFPALGGLFVTYLYNVVDGIFVGQCYGRKDTEEMKWFFRSGMVINTLLSVTIFGILFIFDVPVIRIFNKEPELVQTATAALPLFAVSFIPMAYNLIYTAFLFSTKRTGASNVIAISRGIVLKSPVIFCIPLIAGTDAIWIAPFVAEMITLVIAVVLKETSKLVYQ